MRNLALILTTTVSIACSEKENDTATQDTGAENTDTEDTGEIYSFDPTDDFENPSGCSDFLFFDRNADDSSVLELQGQGLAESAHTSEEAISVTYDITEIPDDLQLLIKFGVQSSHLASSRAA